MSPPGRYEAGDLRLMIEGSREAVYWADIAVGVDDRVKWTIGQMRVRLIALLNRGPMIRARILHDELEWAIDIIEACMHRQPPRPIMRSDFVDQGFELDEFEP